MPAVNIQAIMALILFIGAAGVSRMVANIYSGRWGGGSGMVFYLRALVGFLLTGAIVLAFYSFAGIDVISGKM
ncbi:MAG: flagellar biosynthesis protein FliR [Synergistaceae bacterium]|nr:flagellar biosynthesis protein FliR [Synergistaceae bacterium]